MTFHKTKRAVTTLAVMTSWSVLCIASPSAAQAKDSEAGAAKEGWETPFEVTLKGLFVKGPWEGYIGAMITWNIRIFNKERAEFEGQENVLSFGVGGTIGGSYHFTERWAPELGFDYEYVPTDPVVTHGFDFALGGVYHF